MIAKTEEQIINNCGYIDGTCRIDNPRRRWVQVDDVIRLIREKEIKYEGLMGFFVGNFSVKDMMREIKRDLENAKPYSDKTNEGGE
jgi:hypothetical protein